MAKKPPKLSIAQKVLKRKQDPELQKQLAAEQINVEDDPINEKEEEARQAVTESFLQDREVAKRKRIFKFGLWLLAIPLLFYAIDWLFKPFSADIRFGFCRVFLELYVQYPDMLIVNDVEERAKFVRIWYLQTDSFGQERMEKMECHHGYDEVRGYYISKVMIDRRELDPKLVEDFNVSLNTIMAHPPDLTYPRRLRDALGNVNFETYLFRKPIL